MKKLLLLCAAASAVLSACATDTTSRELRGEMLEAPTGSNMLRRYRTVGPSDKMSPEEFQRLRDDAGLATPPSDGIPGRH